MTKSLQTATIAALALCLAAPVAASAAGAVSVRVEGTKRTLVPAARVHPSSSVKVDKRAEGGTTCSGATAAGALELATHGDWGGPADSFGQEITHILGETHTFDSDAYWAIYVNNAPASAGICNFKLAAGDELLLAPVCTGAPAADCFSQDPLELHAPHTAAPGKAITVTADEWTSPFGATATKAPSAGATVSSDRATSVTAADGTATLTFLHRGLRTVTVTKGARIRDERFVCVTDGHDAGCKPRIHVRGIHRHERFSRAHAPRRLRGQVQRNRSGIAEVRLGLERTRHGHHWRLTRHGRFRRGHARTFELGTPHRFHFALKHRLRAGRYALTVVALDGAGQRNRRRVEFRVR